MPAPLILAGLQLGGRLHPHAIANLNVWNRLALFLKLIFVSKTILKFSSKNIDNYNWKHIVA